MMYLIFIILSIMVISSDSFSFGAAYKCKLNVVTAGGGYSSDHAVSNSRSSTSLRALKEGAEEKIKELRAELSQLDSDNSWKSMPEGKEKDAEVERRRSLRTICDCANALADIERDLQAFEEHLRGDDDNLKRVAEGFSKEFLLCREQIETQLNILL